MAQINFTAADAGREIADLERRLATALGALRKLPAARPGATPRDAIMHLDGITLYRYQGPRGAEPRPPLLIVYALVNRPEMADLQDGRSLIAGLIERGFDVYLIDWGYPGGADRLLGLDDYIARYLDACVEHLCRQLERERLTLLGICQGGTFSACYAALKPERVERLVTTVTPIDFHTADDMLSHLVRHVDIDALVDSRGNIDGDTLNALFLSLKPYRLLQQKYLRFVEHLDDEAAATMFLRMEHWIFDSPALTARACREFGRGMYQENRLVRGELEIAGRTVDLGRLDMPVLNIYARDDHLVPPASSTALGRLVKAGNYTEREVRGGHIGIYVSTRQATSVPALVGEWYGQE